MSIFIQRLPQSDGVAIDVRNTTGGLIARGRLLYISGYDLITGRYLVNLAQSNDITKPAMFVIDADLPNNSDGTAYTSRLVSDLNTSTATAEGDKVYLSTNGTFLIGASFNQWVGIVTKKDPVIGQIRFLLAGGVGVSGFSGYSGTIGPAGASGPSGPSGANGTSGFSGFSTISLKVRR